MGDSSGKWNFKNPAVKRILRELKEVQQDNNLDIVAEALEDNIFEWLFAIRGAWGTEFEGGIYHGRILMPAEYPFKPPAFVMMTPSGRFETGTKICLSISSYHPESWQPSWSVQSALVALIAFMQTPGNGAIGSLDTSADVRKEMAGDARNAPPRQSSAERQSVVDALHQRMIESEEQSRLSYKRMTESQCVDKKEGELDVHEESAGISVSNNESPGHRHVQQGVPSVSDEAEATHECNQELSEVTLETQFEQQNNVMEQKQHHADTPGPENANQMFNSDVGHSHIEPLQLHREQSRSTNVLEDILLTGAAIVLIMLIAFIILKKAVSFTSLSQQEDMLSGANLVQSEL
eukprot:jgi/Picsp_1/1943/NSC_05409-R1_ubiquitin-conjugating enzyme e2